MIYLIIFLFLSLLSVIFDFLKKKRGRKVFYFLAWLALFLLAALRYKVGGDTYNYIHEYQFLPSFNELFSSKSVEIHREPGWLLINATAKLFSNDFITVQIILSLIVNSTFFWFIKKYTKYYFLGILVYYVFFYCYVNFEILRESLALCVFMLGFESLLQKNYKKYYCYAITAIFFHVSAIILLFFPFFYNRSKKISTKIYIYPVVIFILGIILSQFMPTIFQLITFSSILSNKINSYNSYSFTVFGVLSSIVYYIIVPLYFITVLKKQKALVWLLPMLVIYTMIGASITLYTIFFRFLNYIIPFYIIILTEYFMYIYHKDQNYSVNFRTAFFAFILVFAIFSIKYLRAYKADPNIRWYSHWYPYYSVFDKTNDPNREKIYMEGWDYDDK